jgi:hypothetical protein
MDEFKGWTNARHSDSYSILLRSHSGKAKMTFDIREECLFLLIPPALLEPTAKVSKCRKDAGFTRRAFLQYGTIRNAT